MKQTLDFYPGGSLVYLVQEGEIPRLCRVLSVSLDSGGPIHQVKDEATGNAIVQSIPTPSLYDDLGEAVKRSEALMRGIFESALQSLKDWQAEEKAKDQAVADRIAEDLKTDALEEWIKS